MITIDQLIKHCLHNNESPKQFRILYNQLIHRTHVEPKDLFQGLNPRSSLQYLYIYEIFNYELGISKIFDILNSKELVVQLNFIKLLLQDENLIKDADFDINFNLFLKKTLHKGGQRQQEIGLRDLIIDLSVLVKSKEVHVYQDLANQMSELSLNLQIAIATRQNLSSNPLLNNTKNANVYKFIKMKKFSWLNFQVLNYRLHDDQVDEFINTFTKIINNSSSNYVLTELLSSSFECMNVAELGKDEIMIKNWEFFIVERLPLILHSHLKLNLEIFELIVSKSMVILTNADIKLKFVKSLISLKLIKLEKFYHLLGNGGGDNIEINELMKFQNESIREHAKFEEFNHIQNIIDKDLMESNPEFTIIDDENKLYILCKDFNTTTLNLHVKLEFSKIITTTIVQLCDTKDSTRLRRLLFCLSSNLSTLDNFMFNTNPNLILQKLVEICCNSDYLNKDSTTVAGSSSRSRRRTIAPEDVSMFGDDDDDEYEDDDVNGIDQEQNHQELYTDFSCILMHIIFIQKRYRLPTPRDNLFILNLLHHFASSSNVMDTDINLQNLQEWYNSIYNDNESLISDALIAKTTLVDSLQLIPIIFNNSMISYENKELSLELLMNGFEFFMQPFLIINLISIFHKLDKFLWLNNTSDLIWKICNRILSIKLEGESKLMFELIWNHINDDIQHWKSFSLGNSTNQDYTTVIAKLKPDPSCPVRSLQHSEEYKRHLQALINWNLSSLSLSIYREIDPHYDFVKIIKNLIEELGTMLNHSIDSIQNDQKNSAFLSHLEISSFLLLVFFQFDKKYLPNLSNLVNNEEFQTPIATDILRDLQLMLKAFQGNDLNHTILSKLVEKIYQHLLNL